MGGLCSRRSTEDNLDNTNFPHVNGLNYGSGMVYQSRASPAPQVNHESTPPSVVAAETIENKHTLREPFSFPEMNAASYALDDNDGIPRLSRAISHKSRSTKSNLGAVTKVCLMGVC